MKKIFTKHNLLILSVWALIVDLCYSLFSIMGEDGRFEEFIPLIIIYGVMIVLLVAFHRYGRWIQLIHMYLSLIGDIFIGIMHGFALFEPFDFLIPIYFIVILLQKEAFDLFHLDASIRKKEFIWTFVIAIIISSVFIALYLMIGIMTAMGRQ